MIYGKEKIFHLQRSILPSSARKRAKYAKDHLHRQNRRRNNQDMHEFRGYASDVIEDFEDSSDDYNYWIEPHNNSWDSIVFDRRGSDKLAHFEHWAWKKTRYLRKEDRLSKIAGLLPKNTIGLHALSHLYFLDYRPYYSFIKEGLTDRDMVPRRIRPRYRYRSEYEDLKDKVKTALLALNTDERYRFNSYMEKNASYYFYFERQDEYSELGNHLRWVNKKIEIFGWRKYHGPRDVHKYVNDIYSATFKSSYRRGYGYHPHWWTQALKYLGIENTL